MVSKSWVGDGNTQKWIPILVQVKKNHLYISKREFRVGIGNGCDKLIIQNFHSRYLKKILFVHNNNNHESLFFLWIYILIKIMLYLVIYVHISLAFVKGWISY
jgi:hypothetical protein